MALRLSAVSTRAQEDSAHRPLSAGRRSAVARPLAAVRLVPYSEVPRHSQVTAFTSFTILLIRKESVSHLSFEELPCGGVSSIYPSHELPFTS